MRELVVFDEAPVAVERHAVLVTPEGFYRIEGLRQADLAELVRVLPR